MATLQETMAQRQRETQNRVGDLYNKQYDSQAAQLRSAYDKNMSDAQAEQAKIAPQYQTQANAMAAQYERNRRNANLGAMNSGLGTGNAVQQQLAMNQMYQKNYAGLRGNELQAQAAAAQNQAGITADYQNALAKARADAENKKAAAMVDTQNDMNNWYDQQAKILAGYGDFSAYERLYGKEAADYMRKIWELQNPKLK
jgi:hypothetical protein